MLLLKKIIICCLLMMTISQVLAHGYVDVRFNPEPDQAYIDSYIDILKRATPTITAKASLDI